MCVEAEKLKLSKGYFKSPLTACHLTTQKTWFKLVKETNKSSETACSKSKSCASEENRKKYKCLQVTCKITVRSPQTEFEELVTVVKAAIKR